MSPFVTQLSGQSEGTCSPAPCKAEKETFPGVMREQRDASPTTQYLSLFPSPHSDSGSRTLCASQNCQDIITGGKPLQII